VWCLDHRRATSPAQFMTMGAQAGLVLWRKQHKRSYDLVRQGCGVGRAWLVCVMQQLRLCMHHAPACESHTHVSPHAGQSSGAVADARHHLAAAQVLALPCRVGGLLPHHGPPHGAVHRQKDAPQHATQGERATPGTRSQQSHTHTHAAWRASAASSSNWQPWHPEHP
jgi:hypothetical protein